MPSSAVLAPAIAEADSTIVLPGRGELRLRQYGRKRTGTRGRPLVLHFHGGTFVSGDLDSGACLARLMAEADAVVVSVAYPLAPANPFPTAVETGYAALEWLHKQRTKLAGTEPRIYVAGEEAGGNLAAAVTLVARDMGHPALAGQLLIAPMLDPCTGTPSLREATCDMSGCKYTAGWQQYLRSPRDAEHPYAVPGRVWRLAGLPPTLVLTGADDPMRDEALAYAHRLEAGGIPVRIGVLAPLTGWPDSLSEATPAECPCSNAAREHLRAFFQAAAPPPPC
jgi:acetyl esterase